MPVAAPGARKELSRRRTFAIISHPDAGKTTMTEQLLLYGGAIQMAGTVKARKAARHATSDWMAMERERGISITSSVMQFRYRDTIINLLDTPGHADFSEDTYRTLTAVDSALMVIDAAKGVEERTRKLMDVCRMRDTPVITFINKLDREGRAPVELMDDIESQLGIQCAPVTWPAGMGSRLKGIYHLERDLLYPWSRTRKAGNGAAVAGLDSPEVRRLLDDTLPELAQEVELVRGACPRFEAQQYQNGVQTPVFFGSALHKLGVEAFLDCLVDFAPQPQPRTARERTVQPGEDAFTGFVFKIQANMDPAHHDRIAFVRICSGHYEKGMRLHQVRVGRDVQASHALTFMAGDRDQAESAWPGDIIGLHNHGTIQVGDTFTQGEQLNFTGIPYFAPELFRRVRLKDPLRSKALLKGLLQLGEEGAVQVFRPLQGNDLIVGAVGTLQFEVVAWRLREEYGVECGYDTVPVVTARWVECDDPVRLKEFTRWGEAHLARDGTDRLTYLAPTRVNLNLAQERWPEVRFLATREHQSAAVQ